MSGTKIGQDINTEKEQGIADVVANHYNSRPEIGVEKRKQSNIFNLRCFNNWVKSILIKKYTKYGNHVLDMGCGKGGDLLKFQKAKISYLVGADLASVSIEQAKERFRSLEGSPFEACFIVHDCYRESISEKLPNDFSADVVSLQFCMHYAFESEKMVRIMLQNVSQSLKTGGHFIGTIPDAYRIVKKLKEASGLEFGNSVYKIRFEYKDKFPIFGHKYWFALEDAVDDCPEYLVHFPTFQKMALEYNLKLKYHENFHSMYLRFHNDPELNELLYRMKVLTEDPDFQFDPDQWDAVGCYLGFCFIKI